MKDANFLVKREAIAGPMEASGRPRRGVRQKKTMAGVRRDDEADDAQPEGNAHGVLEPGC